MQSPLAAPSRQALASTAAILAQHSTAPVQLVPATAQAASALSQSGLCGATPLCDKQLVGTSVPVVVSFTTPVPLPAVFSVVVAFADPSDFVATPALAVAAPNDPQALWAAAPGSPSSIIVLNRTAPAGLGRFTTVSLNVTGLRRQAHSLNYMEYWG